MKKISSIIMACGVGCAVQAEACGSGCYVKPYVAGRLAYAEIVNDAAQWTNATGPTSTIADQTLRDEVWGLKVAVGGLMPFKGVTKALRLEAEYGLFDKAHNTGDFGLRFPLGTVMPSTFELKTRIQTMFANLYYDLNTKTAFTPYVGAGLGWAHINETGTVYTPVGVYTAKASYGNLAWNVGAGLAYDVTDDMAIEAGYRYTDYGYYKKEGGTVNRDYSSHEFTVGIRYAF